MKKEIGESEDHACEPDEVDRTIFQKTLDFFVTLIIYIIAILFIPIYLIFGDHRDIIRREEMRKMKEKNKHLDE
jgi:hypothetical protein